MKAYDFPQYSPEWYKAHMGIPTASAFSKIITPKTRKLSSQADGYENRLVAERLTGDPIDDFKGTDWMERGSALEAEAVLYYEMQTGLETRPIGFVTNDAGTWGCSPDRLIGTDGGLEIKCPSPGVHVGNCLSGGVDLEHYAQVQGCILICECNWWGVLSYHDKIPSSIVRVARDDEFCDILEKLLWDMDASINRKLQIMKGM